MFELDITDFKERTKETLSEAISKAVKDTQRVIIRDYPDVLKMTKDQYALLSNQMQPMFGTEDMLYRTKYNVMEVRVD